MGCSETATFTIQNQRIFPDVKVCSWFFPDVKLYSWFLVFALISQSSNSGANKAKHDHWRWCRPLPKLSVLGGLPVFPTYTTLTLLKLLLLFREKSLNVLGDPAACLTGEIYIYIFLPFLLIFSKLKWVTSTRCLQIHHMQHSQKANNREQE